MNIYIGIDPDVKKSGVALIDRATNKHNLYNYSFFELFDFLNELKNKSNSIEVYVEGGWLNKSNWHIKGKNQKVSTQIGKYTGENHQVGKKIVEMCEYLKLNHFVLRPTKSKLNADSFKKITNITDRLNQEQRDAYMLIFGR